MKCHSEQREESWNQVRAKPVRNSSFLFSNYSPSVACLRYFDFAQYDKQAYTTLLCHSEQREESLQSSANVSPSIQHSKFIISYNAKRRFATSISHFSFLISIFLRDYFFKIISQMRSTSSCAKSAYSGKVSTLSAISRATGVSFTSYLSL